MTKPFLFGADGPTKRHAPATLRNRDAICHVLGELLPTSGTVLEVASGTGEHVVHFAAAFPHLVWQPSDLEPAGLQSIAEWTTEAALPNIRPPLLLNASMADWPIDCVNAILCINMIHIAPWEATLGLFAGAARHLTIGGLLYLYGPFFEADVETAQSNLDFDASLRARNPEWGVRNKDDVCSAAGKQRFVVKKRIEMPANNISLVFELQSI